MDEIYDLTCRFVSDLEDAKDMRDDLHQHISLYEPFQNFIEGNEYECYIKYTEIIADSEHDQYLTQLLNDERVHDYLQVRREKCLKE